MIIKFNPTGTHTHKDQLKVRLDLYPDAACKSYDKFYVYTPVISQEYTGLPEDYQSWLDGLPHIWMLNPCLSIFVKVDENITPTLLTQFISDVYTKDVLATIDDVIIQTNSAHLISPYLRNKTNLSSAKVTSFDEQAKSSIDAILKDFSISKEATGNIQTIQPKSIDVGTEAINRSFGESLRNRTVINYNNSANATGTIDTVEIWTSAFVALTYRAGSFIDNGADSFTCNDGESLGSLEGGAKRTITGLTISITVGNYLGCDQSTTSSCSLLVDISGGAGGYTIAGTYCDPSDTGTYTLSANCIYSLYGTGTEGGGDILVTAVPLGIGISI